MAEIIISSHIDLFISNRLLAIVEDKTELKDNIWERSRVVEELIVKGLEAEKSKPPSVESGLNNPKITILKEQIESLQQQLERQGKIIEGLEKRLLTPNNFEADTFEESISGNKYYPRKLLKLQFRGLSQTDIVLSILRQEQKPMRASEIALIAYQTDSEEDFARARNCISAELRLGIRKKLWARIGAGLYALKSMENLNG